MEVSLLLPGWELAALERNALNQGLTVGQLTRRLIRSFLRGAQHEECADADLGLHGS